MVNTAIVVAAGQGKRFGAERAKQFLELCGIPVIIHALRSFELSADIHEVVCVVPASETQAFLHLAASHKLAKLTRVVAGGATRADSVRRGLQTIRATNAGIVAVHDGARPFVTALEISNAVNAAQRTGAAILVAPVTDTIKQVSDGKIAGTLDRSTLRRALTPQCFSFELLRRAFAHAGANADAATDDCALVEALGVEVTAVEGDPQNIKITFAEDLVIAEAVYKQRMRETK